MRLKQVFSGLAVLGLIGLLTGCTTPKTTTKAGQIKILTSLNFYGETAKQVAGKYGQVTAVINRASIDPHDFEPTVKTAKQASSAALIIDNGLGYDGWMSKLTTNKADGTKVLTVGTTVAGKANGANEHVWYDPTTMPKLATAIAKQLGTIQPAHRQYFLKQAAQYQTSLKPLTKLIKQLKANVHGQKVAVSEPVFDYALKSLGYKISNNHFAMAIENGADPSPKDIQQMQQAIKHHRIAFFVENTQSDSNIVDNMVQLAHQYNVPVLKVTETLPAHQTYRSWMLSQYRQLEKIQQATK
ncbi:metal ABC transporter solute-binding protein, Zn/Mn family [Lactiplantibacillus mudanjiangensis]|uniref:Metal ABC transporter substrate-binding protein [Lactobacillus sp.] n=1 Tax=Lactiplantibacillus mudanjiangensis TaxID=1296538 RepID=A0A660E4V4_9LACO|nr:zinc ABC transporter substrate-binding protein [Lactiplantibacillus mudanjiangensis]VDG20386.1 metal ABC transporter substrate-binding protein [Lactobacillus sp.] [Lactiplantibacillus mudanjiangensis]VDG23918.1 metal ABC transporter substrate-binding protein [Lactobacillus sp.] [Lactiplantibacillus mudanjiangensis]VDG27091.1 metal ABC transporter substrate-binding protein [Lactobacillus sp.] [Lactiplantibacillus mudanjiangensis]VDG34001.1 metal ABC transporter substrate-binding protein [Lact